MPVQSSHAADRTRVAPNATTAPAAPQRGNPHEEGELRYEELFVSSSRHERSAQRRIHGVLEKQERHEQLQNRDSLAVTYAVYEWEQERSNTREERRHRDEEQNHQHHVEPQYRGRLAGILASIYGGKKRKSDSRERHGERARNAHGKLGSDGEKRDILGSPRAAMRKTTKKGLFR